MKLYKVHDVLIKNTMNNYSTNNSRKRKIVTDTDNSNINEITNYSKNKRTTWLNVEIKTEVKKKECTKRTNNTKNVRHKG